MINPTVNDIGREVVYKPIYGELEYGVITRFNEYWVFVRYTTQDPSQGGKATHRDQLHYKDSYEFIQKNL